MLRNSILEYLSAVAATQWVTAAAWHVALGTLLAALAAGWRPSQRRLGTAMALLPASVALMAGRAGNPFNAAMFTLLTLLLVRFGRQLPSQPVIIRSKARTAVAAVLIAFGWLYPHFVSGPWTSLLYASPLGIIPCPTLATLVGLTLLVGAASSRAGRLVGAAAMAYGVLGVFYLGVTIDVVLLAGGLLMLLTRRPAPQPAAGRTGNTASAPRTCSAASMWQARTR